MVMLMLFAFSVRRDIETKFPIYYFGHACPKYETREFRNYISLNLEMRSKIFFTVLIFYSANLWTCSHHMVILRNQNKSTDLFMILA